MRGPLVALAILGATVAGVVVARRLLTLLAARLAKSTETPLDETLVRSAKNPLGLLVLLLGAREATLALGATGHVPGVVDTILFLSAVALVLVSAIQSYQTFLAWYARRATAEGGSETIARDFLPLARSVGILALFLIALSIAMGHFGQSVSSLVVSLGVGSLAIGLAAQDTLANMIAGFLILIDKPFHLGDRLELAPGQQGEVAQIGLRATRIRLLDGTTLVAPNSDLLRSRILVLARASDPPIVKVKLGVTYRSDPALAKSLLVAAAQESSLVLPDPVPRALLLEIGQSSLNILLLAWIKDVRSQGDALDDIHSRILVKLRSSEVELACPVTEVRLRQGAALSAT
ncbi:MAG: mechanosensitive ion channel family protein [Acidobacteriota bacterium]